MTVVTNLGRANKIIIIILQILPKLFGYGPFQSQELQFRRVILQLASLGASTGLGYRMIMAIGLLLGEHCPQSLY